MVKNTSRIFIRLSILLAFWIIWFVIYSFLNSRGSQIGIHWKSPDIYVPIMVYPYVFGMALLVILPFAFHLTDDGFYNLLFLYLITSITMFVIYYIYPVFMIRREYAGPLIADALMRWIVGMDDPANCFPSNHCAISTLGYIGIHFSKAAGWLKILTFGLALSVCLSTVLVGQHYWIDIPTGIGLSLVLSFFLIKIVKLKVAK